MVNMIVSRDHCTQQYARLVIMMVESPVKSPAQRYLYVTWSITEITQISAIIDGIVYTIMIVIKD